MSKLVSIGNIISLKLCVQKLHKFQIFSIFVLSKGKYRGTYGSRKEKVEYRLTSTMRNSNLVWNQHYGVYNNSHCVAEFSSFDRAENYIFEHTDDFPNGRVYAIWDLLRKDKVIRSLIVDCEKEGFDFKSNEQLFFDAVKHFYNIDLGESNKVDFVLEWH